MNITGINYNVNNTIYAIDLDLVEYRRNNNRGQVMDINLSSFELEGGASNYLYVEIEHAAELPQDVWTFVSLYHPKTSTQGQAPTTRDMFNSYAFTPGHFVEIRYTSVQFFTIFRPDEFSSTWERFKSFIGYMDPVEDYSYQSTVQHIPFPIGMYGPHSSVIVLRPPSVVEFTEYEEEKTSFKDTMAKIGGLLSLVGSIVVFLFGVSLVSPWGFLASLPFFRRRMSNSLAKAYNSAEGFSKGPFTTHIDEIGDFDHTVPTNDMKITMLKERIDELELVLSEYYLDGCVFQHYSEERDQVRLERAKTRIGRPKSKQMGQDQYQQQQQQRPYYNRQPSSEITVSAYYQQQQQINKKQGESQQSLLDPVEDDDITRDHGFASPPFSEYDAQRQGLLQLDHNQLHQSHIQKQELVQSPPSGPMYSSNRGFAAAPTTGQDAFAVHNQSPVTSTAAMQLSPSPPVGAAAVSAIPIVAAAGREDEVALWWKANPAPATAPAYRPRPTSVAAVQPGLGGASSATESTYEHHDMTDLSKLRRED
ncbi:hypothetical protein BGZ75_003643 [Mortierella antarctica]|nr:hypothetical protein BGZ75_003643 [Mortierella antarctica]